MTAYGSEDLAVQAIRGRDDYIAKGRMQLDELEMRIARAQRREKLREAETFPCASRSSRGSIWKTSLARPGDEESLRDRAASRPSKASVLILAKAGRARN